MVCAIRITVLAGQDGCRVCEMSHHLRSPAHDPVYQPSRARSTTRTRVCYARVLWNCTPFQSHSQSVKNRRTPLCRPCGKQLQSGGVVSIPWHRPCYPTELFSRVCTTWMSPSSRTEPLRMRTTRTHCKAPRRPKACCSTHLLSPPKGL